jgi:hypothetical protein
MGPSLLNATALIVAIRTTKWPRQVRRVLERGAELDAEIQLAANVACRVMTTDDEDAPKSAKILQFRNRTPGAASRYESRLKIVFRLRPRVCRQFTPVAPQRV